MDTIDIPAKIRAGDLEACLSALEGSFDFVHHALRRHGVSDADVEDLVQEVFLVMWRRWAQYDPARPLRPWLSGIAFRVAYNHRQKALREVPGGLVDLEDETPDPEQRIASRNLRALVRGVLDALPEKHRTLILLHDVDGVSVREIAAELAIPIPTAHTRLRAARKVFAQALRRQEVIALARARLTGSRHAQLPVAVGPEPPAAARPSRKPRGRALVFLPLWSRSRPRPPATPGTALTPTPAPLPRTPWRALGGATILGASAALLLTAGPARPPQTPRMDAQTRPAAVEASSAAPARLPKRFEMLTAMLPAPATTRFVPPPAPDPRTEPLGWGLRGYWRFDEPAGSTLARDLSGNGNDCFLRGLDPIEAWSEGKLGGGMTLSGRGWLECPKVDALARLEQEMTIALWVRRAGPKAHVRALVTRQFGTRRLDIFHFGFRNDSIALRSRVKGGPAFAPFPAVRGLWHHVAATLDREGHARLYVDGELVGSKLKAGRPPLGGGDNPLILGAGINGPDPDAANERFRGVIDEVLIYDRPLDAAEVRALAEGVQPRLSP